ncbi:MAG: anaerobic sulfatase-maturation protein [Bacteroidales bacterium]
MKSTLLFTDALKLKRPTSFQVMLKPSGPVCNLSCSYCYYLEKSRLYPSKKEMRMSYEILEKFTRQYIESQQVPVITFTWQGGEPCLMGLDFYRKAIELQKKYAGGKKIENSFQTNGTLLDDEWGKFLADNRFLVGISIDGPRNIHDHFRKRFSGKGTFDEVMKGIELLHKYKVEFNTLSTVNSHNVVFAREIYKFLKQIGSGFMQFLPVVERKATVIEEGKLALVDNGYQGECQVTDWSVKGKDYGRFLITIFDEWVRNDVGRYFVQIFDATLANTVGEMPGICVFSQTCGDALAMEHNGDIYSCDHFVYPGYLLGNINERPLSEIVQSQEQFDFGIDKRNRLPNYCLRCEVRYACHGECPKHRIVDAPGGEPGLNWLCEGYKDFFHHVTPFMEYMARELENKRAPANVMQWIRNKENQSKKPVNPERNDPCPCGSGKKFKNCCFSKPPYK